MKFDFTQLYAEVDTDFDLSHMILRPLRLELDSLGKNILPLALKLKSDDFTLKFIISATRKSSVLKVKGPLFLYKRKHVEFSLFIPYAEFGSFIERIEYVLLQISTGIKSVLFQYEVDDDGIDAKVQKIFALVKENPMAFEYK
jgi:hypothetical protein